MQLNFTTILAFAGLIGVLTFIGLRPAIDFQGSKPIDPGKDKIEQKAGELLAEFGFQTDTLHYVSFYHQREAVWNSYSTNEKQVHPGELNRSGFPVSGWGVNIIRSFDTVEPLNSLYDIQDGFGKIIIEYTSDQRLYYVDAIHPLKLPSPPLEWISERSGDFIENHMGYSPRIFELDTLTVDGEKNSWQELALSDSIDGSNVLLTWKQETRRSGIPHRINMDMELNDGNWVLSSISTSFFDDDQPGIQVPAEPELFGIAYIIVIFIVLGLIILVTGLRTIFKGQVEWHRVWITFLLFFILFMLNRYLVTNPIISAFTGDIWLIDTLNITLGFLLLTLIVCLAYLSWEAIGREQSQHQVGVVDNFWQGRFFTKSTGNAILSGYSVAGIILGALALSLFAVEGYYTIHDFNPMGLTLASSPIPPLGLISGSIAYSAFYLICSVVIICSLLNNLIKKEWLYFLVSVPILTLIFYEIGWITWEIGAADFYGKALIAVLLTAISVFVFRYIGIVSLIISWIVSTTLLCIFAFWGASDSELLTHFWVTIGILGLPFLFGLVTSTKGVDPEEYSDYRPDYEERLVRQHRYEKEIQIARDSQLTLMPDSEPEVEGLDVKGFFIPSLEVGGDYFDYDVIQQNGIAKEFNLAIVDVSGKGMQAAITAIFTSGLLLSRLLTDRAHTAMTKVNSILKEKTHPQTFVTCLIAEYQLQNRTLSYANAGNSKPMLKRGKNVQYLDGTSPRLPLGVRENVEYKSSEIELDPGDVLLFYSDGLPEARAESGKFLGDEYIQKLIKWMDTSKLTAAEMCDIIRRKILDFSNYELADDITVVVMKIEK